ncbi:MAG: signal recognition particle protein [Planctomycetota bacterium]|nr:signal recognition particle protein [Planctomycetota bacterium]
MFEKLSDAFNGMFRRLSGKASISEGNVREAMDEVRKALLDADVSVGVVDEFCERVTQDALGSQVLKSLEPGQQMIGIVHQRLVEFLGGQSQSIDDQGEFNPFGGKLGAGGLAEGGSGGPLAGLGLGPGEDLIPRIAPGPTIVMMCGLQGSGKTTTCGKVAAYLKKKGRTVMLVAADLQRPAAIEQLQIVAETAQQSPGAGRVLFHGEPERAAEYGKAVGVAVSVCQRGLEAARRAGADTVILDTAGRLHVNDELMAELHQVNARLQPHLVLLVVDAMTGQDAVKSAKVFHDKLEVDGIILTKFDSDTRGGAAISVKKVTGAPIKFIGVGEKIDALEEFHPTRIAGRILGMGDVVSLVERAQEQVSEADAKKLEEKMAKGEMTMEDFLSQLKTLRRMGPMRQLLGLLPGVGSMLKDVHVDEKQLDRVEAIINSMTKPERTKPSLIDVPRRRRISKGSGSKPEEVGQLVKQFQAISSLSREMAGMSAAAKVGAVKDIGKAGGLGAMVPGLQGMPGMNSRGSTRTPSIKDRFKKRKK